MPPKPRIDPSDPFAGLEELGQESKPSSTNREDGKFYGVPDDYVSIGAPRTPVSRSPNAIDYAAQPRVSAPRYQTASDDDRRLLMNLGPEAVRSVQMALAEVGLIKPNSAYRVGVVDNTTRNAFADLLGYANQEGLDWKTALVKYAGDGGMQGDGDVVGGIGGGGEPAEAGVVTDVANPITLEQQVQQAALSRLGRKLRGGEVQRFITVYQSLERGSNSDVVVAQQQAQGGVSSEVTAGPSMDASALDYVDDTFATEAASQDTYGYFEALKSLVGEA